MFMIIRGMSASVTFNDLRRRVEITAPVTHSGLRRRPLRCKQKLGGRTQSLVHSFRRHGADVFHVADHSDRPVDLYHLS
jgi:hypothetical protein